MKIGKIVDGFVSWLGAGSHLDLGNNPDVPRHVQRQIRLAQGHPPGESRFLDEMHRMRLISGGF